MQSAHFHTGQLFIPLGEESDYLLAADLQFVFERFVNMKQSKAMLACKFEAYYPVEQFNK